MKNTIKLSFILVLFLFVIAFVWRLWGISSDSLWGDEIATVRAIAADLNEKNTRYNHHYEKKLAKNCAQVSTYTKKAEKFIKPTYYCLLNKYIKFIGGEISEFALRSFSLIFGMLFLLFFYLSLRKIYPGKKEIAIIGLALTAFSPYLIYYAQEARHYSLFLFLGAFALYLYILQKQESKLNLKIFYSIILLLSCIAGLWVSIVFLFWIGAFFLDFCFSNLSLIKKNSKILFIIFFILIAICFLYFLINHFPKDLNPFRATKDSSEILERLIDSPKEFLNMIFDYSIMREFKDHIKFKFLRLTISILLPILFLIGLISFIKIKEIKHKFLIILSFILPLFLSFVCFIFSDLSFIHSRHAILSLIPVFIIIATVISFIQNNKIKYISLALILLFYSFINIQMKASPQRQDWKSVAKKIEQENIQSDTAIIFGKVWKKKPWQRNLRFPEALNYYWENPRQEIYIETLKDLKALDSSKKYKRIIFLSNRELLPNFENYIENKKETKNYSGIRYCEFIKKGTPIKLTNENPNNQNKDKVIP